LIGTCSVIDTWRFQL